MIITNKNILKKTSIIILSHARKIFQQNNIDIIEYITSSIHELPIALDECKKNNITHICIIGGDGTIHHIINAYMHWNEIHNHSIIFIPIAAGTGNDWNRSYDGLMEVHMLNRRIKNNHIRIQDLMEISYTDGKKYYSNNIVGVGFDSLVASDTIRLKPTWGTLTYLITLLKNIFFFTAPDLNLKIDNDKPLIQSFFLIIAAKGKYFGNKMMVAPLANVNDGYIDVLWIDNISAWTALKSLVALYSGTHLQYPYVHHIKAKEIIISSTLHEIPVEAEGELLPILPVAIRVIPQALQFI